MGIVESGSLPCAGRGRENGEKNFKKKLHRVGNILTNNSVFLNYTNKNAREIAVGTKNQTTISSMNTKKINRRILLSGAVAFAGVASASAQDNAPMFKVGSVDVRPGVTYEFEYNDNIFLSHRSVGKIEDYIHHIKPGITLGAGDYSARNENYFTAGYNADIQLFQDNSGANATDHNANIAIGGNLGRTKLSLGQTLVSASDADTANLAALGRLKRRVWETTAGAVYNLSDKSDFELELLSRTSDYDNAAAFDTWKGQGLAWWNYKMTPKIEAAFGGGVGYDQVDGTATTHGPNAVYEQILGRLRWAATEKVSFNGNAGLELRQIQEVGVGDKAFAIFGAGVNWQATEQTSSGVNAQRGVSPGNTSQNQFSVDTTVSGNVKHSFTSRIDAGLDAGYTLSDFSRIIVTAATPREDQYWYIKPSVNVKLFERASAAAYYQYRRNDSDLAANGNDFTNHQLGLSLTYSF